MWRKILFTLFLCSAFLTASAASEPQEKPPGPSMMVHFAYYPKDLTRIHALEHRLAKAIKDAGVGELGETEFHLDGNDGYLYMYGPDPERIDRVVGPILKSSRLMSNAEITEWHGARTATFKIR